MAALSDTIPGAYRVLGVLGALVVAVGVVGAVRRDFRLVRGAGTVGSALPGLRAVSVTADEFGSGAKSGRNRVAQQRHACR